MLPVKSVTLCVFLCMNIIKADVITSFNLKDKFNRKDVQTSANIHNSLLTVVTCDKILPKLTTLKCEISQSIVDSESKVSSCEFMLDEYIFEASGHPLTADKAILISHTKEEDEEQYIKYAIVNFANCNTTEAKIQFESFDEVFYNFRENENAIWINEDETFDVLYNDDKVCGDKICRLTIDAQGNVVKGPNPSFSPLIGSIRHVKKESSSESFIVTENRYDAGEFFIRLSMINPDGQQVVVKKVFNKNYGNYYASKDQDVSTSHGSIRLCSRNDRYVGCELLDENGKTISMVRVNAIRKVDGLAVRNLANGEFLLLAQSKDTDVLMKVKSDGFVVGVAVLSYLTHRTPLYYETYIDVDDDLYCVTKKGFGYVGLEVLKECFGDGDFH